MINLPLKKQKKKHCFFFDQMTFALKVINKNSMKAFLRPDPLTQ